MPRGSIHFLICAFIPDDVSTFVHRLSVCRCIFLMCEVLKEADGGAEIILVEVYRFPVCNKLVFLVARKVIKIIVASP